MDLRIPEFVGSPEGKKYLCLTICGYRKAGMSEEAYRNHMVNVSAPMTKELMVKYGVKRWTQVSRRAPFYFTWEGVIEYSTSFKITLHDW